MAKVIIEIEHNGTIFSPPIEDDIKLEWERTGSPGKLTFTVLKMKDEEMSFLEGDPVTLYYDEDPVFVGYVFTKSRDREHRIKVTCYDQLRYLKNKYTYIFEKKKATEIIKSMCEDFSLNIGTFDDTKYIIPTIAEENKSALDIVLDVLQESLVNTGEMYVFYDDCGKLQLKNVANMTTGTLIYDQSAENFDYSSSIDDETYNQVVLMYDPSSQSSGSSGSGSGNGSGGTGTSTSQVNAILNKARSQIGVSETPLGSNNVKYNTAYYGGAVNGAAYPWCCAFVWWVFKECGLSHLFNGGAKTAYCPTAVSWFKSQGRWYTKNYQPGDVIFFSWKNNGVADHVGIVESVNGSTVTCIEGNTGDMVKRVARVANILGVGRPAYSSNTRMASDTSSSASTSTNVGTVGNTSNDVQVFTATSPDTIKQWGLLRYFEKVDNPSIGKNKALALLKLYNKKTRELKVSGAFGDVKVRGGTLIPVKLYLGDVDVCNYMLVNKVTHKFTNDHHTMDLTLDGAWEDTDYDAVYKKIDIPIEDVATENNTQTSTTTSSYTPTVSDVNNQVVNNTPVLLHPVTIEVYGVNAYAGTINITYRAGGYIKNKTTSKDTITVYCDNGTPCTVDVTPKSGCSYYTTNAVSSWDYRNEPGGVTSYNKLITKKSGFRVTWTNPYN